MKNDDLRKYLVQLRDILNQLIVHPKEMSIQKLHEEIPAGKQEIFVYLIPFILDPAFEDVLAQAEDLEDERLEESLAEAEELRYEITAFDKAFLRRWGIRF